MGDAAEIQQMLEMGAARTIYFRDLEGQTALMQACYLQEDPAIIQLLLKAGASVHDQDEWGQTALMNAVREGGHYPRPAIVELLLKAGASVHVWDKSGYTPLMHAFDCTDPDPAIIRLLLEAGADKTVSSQSCDLLRMTALMFACEELKYKRESMLPRIKVLEMLLEAGAGASMALRDHRGTNALVIGLTHSHRDPRIAELLHRYCPPGFQLSDADHTALQTKRKPQPWKKYFFVLQGDALGESAADAEAARMLGVPAAATLPEIRKAYLQLCRAAYPEIDPSVTAAYGRLDRGAQNARLRQATLDRLRDSSYNDADPVTLETFEAMAMEELRGVFLVGESCYARATDAAWGGGRGHALCERSLQKLARQGTERWLNPFTREPLPRKLYDEIISQHEE